jgi:polyribonucleotide 5'-hydroxyl-kinase
LALNHTYTFRSGTKAAIYTWHGTTIEVTGFCSEYIAEETPMISYSNVHFALEKLRDESGDGPRVLVVGPADSGKTSLVKLLTAYAMRMGRQPLVVNTDPQEGLLSIPGSMTAAGFGTIIDVEQGWGSSPTSASTPVPVKLPLCYYYGLASPEDDAKMWKGVISRLALSVRGRLQDDREVRKAGIIVDTAGAISQGKNGFDLVAHLVTEFSSSSSDSIYYFKPVPPSTCPRHICMEILC